MTEPATSADLPDTGETPLEASEADAADQSAGVWPDEGGAARAAADVPLEVDPADRADQDREVPLDEDDYR